MECATRRVEHPGGEYPRVTYELGTDRGVVTPKKQTKLITEDRVVPDCGRVEDTKRKEGYSGERNKSRREREDVWGYRSGPGDMAMREGVRTRGRAALGGTGRRRLADSGGG
ncbi:hypothetical protein AAG570_000625 [Ranatra chinensis]|uniref:Uncharacterized protein n=1 Tax=Ranatra chinensis TaxID=642074 RepID=A0ABD0YXW5_9HEMI